VRSNVETLLSAQEVSRFKPEPSAVLPGQTEAWTHYRVASILWVNGSTHSALAELRECIRLEPVTAGWHKTLGLGLLQCGRVSEAVVELRTCCSLDPNQAEIHLWLGNSLWAKGDLEESVAEYRKALHLLPPYFPARRNLGIALLKKGATKDALAEFRQAIELQPNFSPPYTALSGVLANCPDQERRDPKQAAKLARQAIQLAQRAVEEQPINGGFWNWLGQAQYRAGNWSECLVALDRSMQLRNHTAGYLSIGATDPKGGDSFDYFFLAMAHARLGHMEDARDWYDKAIEWMNEYRPGDGELRYFRDEAAEVLGIHGRSAEDQTGQGLKE
jgi:superkiller protein 3